VSRHPIVACYRSLDSADAVRLGARLAGVLDEPLVLASAYRYEPVGLGARAMPDGDNERRAAAAESALRRACGFVPADLKVSERIVPSSGIAAALVGLARDVDACALTVGRDTEAHVTRSLIPRAPCPVAVAPLSVPLPHPDGFDRIGVAFDGSETAYCALVATARLAHSSTGYR
jgi:nucleotide-binding universal stress UspA family protein